MESWRFLVAVVLMIAVVVITNVLFPPAPPAPEEAASDDTAAAVRVDTVVVPEEAAADRIAPAPREEAPPPEPTTPDAPATSAPATAAAGDTVVVESPLYRYAFGSAGVTLLSAELLGYESFVRPGPVQLVPADSAGVPRAPLLAHRVQIGDRTVDLGEVSFEANVREPVRLEPGSAPETVSFRGRTPDGLDVVLDLTFHPERYVVDVRGRLQGAARAPVWLVDMGPRLGANEADIADDERGFAYVVNATEGGIRRVMLKDVEERRVEEGPLAWAALKSKYFVVAAIVADGEDAGFGGLIAQPAPGEHAAALTVTLPDADADGELAYRLYMGPQESGQLAAVGHEFSDVNPIGWRIFRPIISPLAHLVTWALVELHGLLDVGYGWVLIVFGFLVRGLLWPLNAKAMRAQLKNMEVQPLMKEVQAKYKNDPERLQKEMLRLYREEGFSPLGGCLPMLIPFPVLLTLFFVFQNTIEFRGVEFLWLPDLSRPDPLYLLPILLGVSMFVLQWISMRSTPQQNPQMKMMMWFMPIFMVVIFFNLASGLNLYYAASNVATVPQQIMLMRERKQFHDRTAKKEEAKKEDVAEPQPRSERRRQARRQAKRES